MREFTPRELRHIRISRNLTQKEMAEVLGLAEYGDRNVRYFESGEKNPSGSTMKLYELLHEGKLEYPE